MASELERSLKSLKGHRGYSQESIQGNASVKKGRKKQQKKRAQNQPDVENSSSSTQVETSVTVPPSVVALNTSGVSAKSTSGSSIDISPKLSGEGQSENTEEYKEGTPGTDSQEGSKSKNKKKHKKNKKKTNPVATEGKEISNDQTCKEPKALQSTITGNLLTSNSELPSNNKNNKTSPQDVTKTQSGKKSKKSRKRTNQNTGLNEECKILSNLQESCDNFLCTHKESECVKHKKVATEFSNKFDISSLHFLTENSFDFSKNSASDEEKSIATPAFKNSEPDLVDFGKPLHPKPHFLTEIEFTALDQLKNIRKLAHDTNLSERLFSTYSFKENQVSDCFKELTIPVFTHSVGEPVFSEELKTLQKNREVAREARQHFKPKNIFDLSNLTASSFADSTDECRITELEELSDINVKTDSSGEKLLDDPFVKDTNSIHNIRHYFDFSSKSKFEPYSFATQDFASEIRLFSPSISSLQQELKESTDQLKTFMECFPPEVEASPTFGEDLKNFSDENNTSDSDSKTSSPNKSTLLFEIKSPGFTNFDHFNQPKANPYLSKETFNAAVGSKHGNNLSQPCSAVVSPEDDFPCQKLEQDHSSEKTKSNDSVNIQEVIAQSETEGNYVLFESGNILNDWYTAKCTSPVEQSEYPESINQPESPETMENQHPPKSDSENAGSVLPENNRTLSSPVKDNQKKLPGKVRTESSRMAKETEEKSSPSEPSENAVTQKTKAELKAERRAIQEAQRAAKTEKKKNEGTYNQKKSEQDGGSPTSSTEAGETVKSKAELRAERRALQEAQRAAKAAKKAEEGSKAAPKIPETPATAAESRRGSAISSDKQKDAKSSKESTPSSVTHVFPQRTKVQRKVQLFEHLHQYEREVSLTQGIPFGSGTVHPAVIRLGLQYAEGVICGSNARCVALLLALKEVIQDYVTPPQKELSRDLEGKLERYSSFLQHCRPISVSMSNAIKSLKWQITHIPNGTADHEAKKELLEAIENYIQENVVLADKAIAALAIQKINDGDVILTYSYSSVINSVLKNAHESGKKFRVVVMDGRPKMEGKKTLVDLIKQGIKCSYVLINAVSYIMREVTKVFLGAHALLANGYVMSRVGSSQIALVAKAYNVPVLVCCETHKFSERVQTDSFVFNELGDPDDLVQTHTKHTYLADWRDIQTFNLLNLVFDVTSPDLISAVVTELGMIPCTSVPVVLRVKHPKN